ncbi:hypothetical protein AOLI_G00096070 [Acnodon oligacanthus]
MALSAVEQKGRFEKQAVMDEGFGDHGCAQAQSPQGASSELMHPSVTRTPKGQTVAKRQTVRVPRACERWRRLTHHPDR